jgi:hypothetical protein
MSPDDLDSDGQAGAFIRRYDLSGAVIWTRQFFNINVAALGATAVAANDSGVFLAGVTEFALPGQVRVGLSDAYLRYLDFDGKVIWTRQFGGIFHDELFGVTTDESAAYVVGNSSTGNPQFGVASRDGFVRKFDLLGRQLWATTIDGTSDVSANGIAFDSTGLYVTGSTAGQLPGETSAGLSDAFVAKLDPGQVFQVAIDVKPGSDQNPTNLSSHGAIAVAILSTSLTDGDLLDFDSTQVDASSVVFAEAAAFQSALEDVDHDGDLDLVLHFKIQDTILDEVYAQLIRDDLEDDGVLDSNRQLAEVFLFGKTLSGDDLLGSDEVNISLSGQKLRDLLDSVFG